MPQPRRDLDLALEAIPLPAGCESPGQQHLHRRRPLGGALHGAIDDALSAAADFLEQLESGHAAGRADGFL
jgi:hypothetical protein